MTMEDTPGYLLMVQQMRNEDNMTIGMVKNIDGKVTPERCNCDASCGENRYHDVGSSGCRYPDNEAYYREYPAMRPKTKKFTKKEVLSCTRPWGSWHVLDVGHKYKVKRLEILPEQAISMQYHQYRSEFWTVVQGKGKANIDGAVLNIKEGDKFFIPVGSIHRVTNTDLNEMLICIEVQVGDICDEEDIVRV
jgi:mannose-6-phosphate isomerase-like protein (cupin superfamily)